MDKTSVLDATDRCDPPTGKRVIWIPDYDIKRLFVRSMSLV
ncbi:MAG: hypothetical protein WAL40_00765 [Rhodoplanes sp.]|jgi:hypothetical protein